MDAEHCLERHTKSLARRVRRAQRGRHPDMAALSGLVMLNIPFDKFLTFTIKLAGRVLCKIIFAISLSLSLSLAVQKNTVPIKSPNL